MKLDDVSAALDRLNQLAPLAKPQLIQAAAATAFVDNETNWRAASALRMICASLDAPLPPQVAAVDSANEQSGAGAAMVQPLVADGSSV